MSVPKGKRKEGKLDVLDASRLLVSYTYDRVKDNNIFPKSDRWMLATDTWREAMSARRKIIRANTIRVETKAEADQRLLYEKEALGHLEVVLDCIDILHIREKISGDRAEHWKFMSGESD